MLMFVVFLAAMALAMAGVHGLIRWSLRAPRVIERETPGRLGLAYSDVRIPGGNGKSVCGWLVPVVGEGRFPAVLILHGWGGNAEMMFPLVSPLNRAGFTVLLIDARNHGRSDTDTFSSMPRFAEDLDCALDWLKVQRGVDPERVGVVGHSVGAAAALLSASRRHDLGAVVSIAAFAHPELVMRRILRGWRIPYVPFGWYVLRYVQRVIGYRFDDIAPLNTISRVQCPVLLVHGTEDTMVPVGEARALHVCRGDGVGDLLLVRGSHDAYEDLERQVSELVGFLERALKFNSGSLPASSDARHGADFHVNRIRTRWYRNEIRQVES